MAAGTSVFASYSPPKGGCQAKRSRTSGNGWPNLQTPRRFLRHTRDTRHCRDARVTIAAAALKKKRPLEIRSSSAVLAGSDAHRKGRASKPTPSLPRSSCELAPQSSFLGRSWRLVLSSPRSGTRDLHVSGKSPRARPGPRRGWQLWQTMMRGTRRRARMTGGAPDWDHEFTMLHQRSVAEHPRLADGFWWPRHRVDVKLRWTACHHSLIISARGPGLYSV